MARTARQQELINDLRDEAAALYRDANADIDKCKEFEAKMAEASRTAEKSKKEAQELEKMADDLEKAWPEKEKEDVVS